MENGRSYSARLGPGELLDLPPPRQRELRRWPPRLLGTATRDPLALKFRITSRTRSSLVKATLAIAATSMPAAQQQHHLRAARQ